MGRIKITYPQRQDPATVASKASTSRDVAQRNAQTSAYAAARFNEWATGTQDREALLNARLQNSQLEAEQKGAEFRYNLWKDHELQKQVTAYYNAMPALQESLKRAGIYEGTPRYAQEMAAFGAEIPRARVLDDNIRKELHEFSRIDADQARMNQMMAEHQGMTKQEAQIANLKQSLANQGVQGTSFSTTAAGGVDVKASRPVNDDLHKLGLTPTQFLNHVNAKQGTFDPNGNFTTDPKFLKPGDTANAIQFQAGTAKPETGKPPTGQLATHNIPLQQFNQIRSDLGVNPIPAYTAPTQQTGVQQPQQTPTPPPDAATTPVPQPSPPDMTGLAQRALNDPNATEEHRARARQILGIKEENAQ